MNNIITFYKTETGISQGTVLGPFLFSLYIKDLPQKCPGIELQMYADDTVIYVSGKTCESAADELTKTLETVLATLDASCSTLNIRKWNLFVFDIKS